MHQRVRAARRETGEADSDSKWALIKVLCLSVSLGLLLCLAEPLRLLHSSLTTVMSGSGALSDSSVVNGLKWHTTRAE